MINLSTRDWVSPVFYVFLGLVKYTECHELLRMLFSTHKPPGFPVSVQFYLHF